ncbi:MAG: Smr/MutS family protein [Novosphingobium sp.]|uniref:Smr/MutS family protein n=1 Tax=Novosphingobium sp. TaxID=1874826 RepID=UPI0032B9806F
MKRRLNREEAQLWARVAHTVRPLPGMVRPPLAELAISETEAAAPKAAKRAPRPAATSRPILQPAALSPARPSPIDTRGLDGSWDKKLARGLAMPDFTLDLHGHSLDAAHARLDAGLIQAKALQARLVLVITGRPRPAEAADRGTRRGAIRAKVLDWLAIGPHGSDIAAVRGAHRRHGGAGAIYVILRRRG